jgi:phosphohistidine phosphatase
MKRIYLVRHAKSSWDEVGVKDEDRPLRKKGIDDAHYKAKILSLSNVTIDITLSSPAFRALNTAIIFAKYLRYPFERIVITESIYSSNKEGLLDIVRSVENKHSSVMIVGHDPALSSLANYLTESNFEKISTSGVVCIELGIVDWKKTDKKSGILKFHDFSKPSA